VVVVQTWGHGKNIEHGDNHDPHPHQPAILKRLCNQSLALHE
jgi:hypothetical protein